MDPDGELREKGLQSKNDSNSHFFLFASPCLAPCLVATYLTLVTNNTVWKPIVIVLLDIKPGASVWRITNGSSFCSPQPRCFYFIASSNAVHAYYKAYLSFPSLSFCL